MAWRYLLQRYTESGWGEFLHTELPLSNISVTNNLSATDELTAEVSPAMAGLKDSAGNPLFDEWGTAVWAEEDGDIKGGGILVSSQAKDATWGLRCIGLSGYPYGMPYTGTGYVGVEVDPLDVVRAAWTHLQSQPWGNLELEIPDLKTGLKIGTKMEQIEFDTENGPISFEAGPIKMNSYETHDLGNFIGDLVEETPFDYREVHWWDGSEIRHKLDWGYPRLGRRLTDYRFVLGENILAEPSIDRDGSRYASGALVLGAGNGRTMIRGYAHRNSGKIRRVHVIEKKNLRSITAANRYAEQYIKTSIVSGSVTTVTLVDRGDGVARAIRPGDEIPLNLTTDWQQLVIWCRVNSVNYTPDTSDDVTLNIVRSDQVS